jgi:protein-S-isoprenylcysteine O-methyltransferase Ste14
VISLIVVWVSRPSLKNLHSHGFYRTFAWEAILVLIVINLDFWFEDPFSLNQIISWTSLILSLVLVIPGVRLLSKAGKPDESRTDPALVGIEKTTELVTMGIYGIIRHPLYSSLIFLAWGAFFKQPSWLGLVLVVVAVIFLTITAKIEEAENLEYFGPAYQTYMKQTKMFIPFLF